MRRTVVFVILLVLATPFAAAAAVRAPGDGTLSVRDLDGTISVWIWSKGGVIGRCDRCDLFIDERLGASEGLVPVVAGARGRDLDADGTSERFVGRDLRWKVMDSPLRMVVRRGVDVDLSIVGKGQFTIQGTNGTFLLNREDTRRVDALPFASRLHPLPLPLPVS